MGLKAGDDVEIEGGFGRSSVFVSDQGLVRIRADEIRLDPRGGSIDLSLGTLRNGYINHGSCITVANNNRDAYCGPGYYLIRVRLDNDQHEQEFSTAICCRP